ncbi:hypothetical protein RCOM_0645150 [Ricinus communis]|uniref:Uncharacterized protein n=1 Tax=Ricinus communis TaxID=3988 RepID=B9SZG0_RICCO|nr:hypothetical protein RCOM_0645150 [Ricinus communis]
MSMAGRVILSQFILSAIPFYAMQTTVVPVGNCDRIDELHKGFIWGSEATTRNVHLVPQDKVYNPRDRDGPSIKEAMSANAAFLMKVAWSVFSVARHYGPVC